MRASDSSVLCSCPSTVSVRALRPSCRQPCSLPFSRHCAEMVRVKALLQVLTTDSGPSRDICPREFEACTLVESKAADCFIAPCGQSSLFGEGTVHQPAWSEPSKDSLVAQLRRLHAAKQKMTATQGSVVEQLRAHLRHWTWYRTGTSMLQRCKALLEG